MVIDGNYNKSKNNNNDYNKGNYNNVTFLWKLGGNFNNNKPYVCMLLLLVTERGRK